MDDNNSGESSCKKHGLTDNSSCTSRPLKKAKFPWQVKGKLHRKDHEEIVADEAMQEEESPPDSTDDSKMENHTSDDENKFENKVEENLEMLGDYLLKQDFSSLNALLTGPEVEQKSVKKPSDTQGTSSTYPKYVPTSKKVPTSVNESGSSNLDIPRSSGETIVNQPSPSVMQQRTTRIEDQYLKRWQARQIAKGYVDNTINRVLDSWFVTPLPPHVDDSRQLTLDVTGLLDDIVGNDGIENEGILMAISAHGLQNNQTNPRIIDSPLRNRNYRPDSPSYSSKDENHKNDTEMSIDNNETETTKLDEVTSMNKPELEPLNPIWDYISQECNCTNIHRCSDPRPIIPFHRRNQSNYVPEVSAVSSEPVAEVPKMSTNVNSMNDRTSDENSDSNESRQESGQNDYSVDNNDQYGEHFDFIDAAVQIAIQSKGLIPL